MSNIRGGHKRLFVASKDRPTIPTNPDGWLNLYFLAANSDLLMAWHHRVATVPPSYVFGTVTYNEDNKSDACITTKQTVFISYFDPHLLSTDEYVLVAVDDIHDSDSPTIEIERVTSDSIEIISYKSTSALTGEEILYILNANSKGARLKIASGSPTTSFSSSVVYTCLEDIRDIRLLNETYQSFELYEVYIYAQWYGWVNQSFPDLFKKHGYNGACSKLNMNYIIFTVCEKVIADLQYPHVIVAKKVLLSNNGGASFTTITDRVFDNVEYDATYEDGGNLMGDYLNMYGPVWAMSYDGRCIFGLVMELSSHIVDSQTITGVHFYVSEDYGNTFEERTITPVGDSDGYYLACDDIGANGNVVLGRCFVNPTHSYSTHSYYRQYHMSIYNIFTGDLVDIPTAFEIGNTLPYIFVKNMIVMDYKMHTTGRKVLVSGSVFNDDGDKINGSFYIIDISDLENPFIVDGNIEEINTGLFQDQYLFAEAIVNF